VAKPAGQLDFTQNAADILKAGQLRCTVRAGKNEQRAMINLAAPREAVSLEPSGRTVQWAANSIVEIAIPLDPAQERGSIEIALSAWKDGLPLDAAPCQGWLTIAAESDWSE